MRSFSATTSIHATPDAIWALLTDAAGYPSWNTTVEKVDGRIAKGEKITLHVKASPRAFPLTVTEMVPGQRMVWSGGMPLGLFKGERTFTLTPKAGGDVEFSMREVFSGPLAGLIGKAIPDLQPAFDEFAASLKRRAEAAS
jgi:hypothetical protein